MAAEKHRAQLSGSAESATFTVLDQFNEIPIRQVCDELGTTLRALRFYEDRGLVAPRRQGSHRLYSAHDVERVRTILKLKSFGLSLREIRQLLRSPGKGPYGLTAELCESLIAILAAQKAALDNALAELQILYLQLVPGAMTAPHQKAT